MANKNSNAKNWKPATLAIHGMGRLPKAHHAVSTPIMHTSNYYFDTADEVEDFMRAKGQGKVIREHEYARYGNPTQIGDRTQACGHRRGRTRCTVFLRHGSGAAGYHDLYEA